MTICRVVILIFALFYLLALGLFLIGTFGLFGEEKDPLSGVFLLPLGLPWNLFLDILPDTARAWATAAAPFVNLILLRLLCMAVARPGGAP